MKDLLRKVWCVKCSKPREINWLKENFADWTRKNEQIDKLIQEIKISKTKYSVKWKNGPCYFKKEYTRNKAKIKYSVNSQNIANEFLSECKGEVQQGMSLVGPNSQFQYTVSQTSNQVPPGGVLIVYGQLDVYGLTPPASSLMVKWPNACGWEPKILLTVILRLLFDNILASVIEKVSHTI
ncbi:hypothetical protein RhiirA4_473819 [Rhizophagus irregularis]|uniref:Uncharacterized protein n=1 Tax=Rhizophagus irregularis TaxID=588596 RepID=A0A2I1H7F9_9GLOM|nr:hypothetical protein RhiirA4_473819 [Rhizophagus irregularis]